ncbi:MAG TPA: osmotically inducible protein OsmC [Bacteroidetes bacterium]|nr:osmotically inducible protein OsmC [Bacteroidota bacterium]
MVSYHIVYQGGLRCEATHDPSQVKIVSDAPVDNHGRGESFSPTDLVTVGYGLCIITTMGIAVQNENILLDGTRLYVEKHMSTDPPRRIAKTVVRIDFAPGVPRERRQYLERIAYTCPVAKSLHPDVAIEVKFTYPD